MALIRIGDSFINPEAVLTILPRDQGRSCVIILPDNARIDHSQSPSETAKLLFPPSPPFDPDDIPF